MSTLKSSLKINKTAIFPNQLSQLPPPFSTADEKTVDTKKKKEKKKENKKNKKYCLRLKNIFDLYD